MYYDAPPSISAHPAPWAYVCEVGRWCDPQFRGDLVNDLGESIAGLLPSSSSSGPVAITPGTGSLRLTGYAPTVEIRPA
jgi:hypothetical protein